MSLKALQIRDEYRSDGQRPARQSHRDRLIQDFYIPCLEQASRYSRAVGFFSSSSMAAVAQGLTAFIHIAFTGSANESLSALIDNFECLDVFTSWDEWVQGQAR